MPKFLTYQRPARVNKQTWGGKPGANPYGAPGGKRPLAAKPQIPAPSPPHLPNGKGTGGKA